ncbi:unnamed protein product [Cuscuta campestris]|uniref:Uncharacterized protein n=1 Tax=Cuscuta campestris TaxID=132261 RepID=A0A484LTK3_9ASTE|nr:unnamed protein product [Cuscuta campestris]
METVGEFLRRFNINRLRRRCSGDGERTPAKRSGIRRLPSGDVQSATTIYSGEPAQTSCGSPLLWRLNQRRELSQRNPARNLVASLCSGENSGGGV